MALTRRQAQREAAVDIWSQIANDSDWRERFDEYRDDEAAMDAIERALGEFDRRIEKILAPHLRKPKSKEVA